MDSIGCKMVMRSFDSYTMESSIKKIKKMASLMGVVEVVGPIPLPSKKMKYTVLRGPHIDKKSREQFEMTVHKRLFIFKETDPFILKSFLNDVVKQNLPIGIGIELVEYHYDSL